MKKYKKYTAIMALLFLVFIAVMPCVRTEAAKTKLSKSKITVYDGKTVTLTLKNNKKKVKWTTSKKSVASIEWISNNKVKITGEKAGTAKITAKVGKKKYICKVTVKKSVKLNETSLTLIKGQVFDLKLTGTSAKPKWTTSKKSVAAISKKSKYVYRVYAKQFGSATVKVKAGGRTYSCKIKVVAKTTPESGSMTEDALKYQEALVKNAKAYWEQGTNIQYSIPGRLSKSDYFKPEEATVENIIETDCSGFARALYMETLGITLPKRTWDLEDYIRENMAGDYVIDALEQDDYTALVQQKQLIPRILSKIEVGDLLLMRFNTSNPKGHVMIGYQWIYDEQGNKTDMWLVHSTGKNNKTENAKSSYVSGFREGSVRIVRLSKLIGGSYSKILESGKSKVFFYGIIRPLAVPGIWEDASGKKSAYSITKSTAERLAK